MRCSLVALALGLFFAGCSTDAATLAPQPPTLFTEHKAAGGFYADYTGPRRSALEAIDAGARYFTASRQLVFDARMAGPIFTGETNYYVWGIQRGSGTVAPFPDEPYVKFDAVAVVTADPAVGSLKAVVNLLGGAPPTPATATLLDPSTIELTVPVSALPMTTATPVSGYQWNLWPRSSLGGSPASQIASFIPENALAGFTAANL
ncbi:MAG: hypothetical protein NVS2B3_17980 [Vulcanimicrobiaceae bacterium]